MGISGILFRSESGALADAVRDVDWEDLLLESDAPPHLVPATAVEGPDTWPQSSLGYPGDS